jgi:hypothetical protein
MVEIPRRRQDHLVARPGQRGQCGAEGLIAARSDRHVLRRDIAAIVGGPALGDRVAQRGVAEHGAVEMRLGNGQRGLGDDAAQRFGRRVHRGGLGEVEERTVGGEGLAGHPAARLHHGGREGGGEDGVDRRGGGAGLRRGGEGGHAAAPCGGCATLAPRRAGEKRRPEACCGPAGS